MAFRELKTFTKSVLMYIKLASTIALILIVLLLVSSYFLAMFLGPALMFSPEGLTISNQNLRPPILLFIIIWFNTPIALNIGLIFLFLCGVFAICLIAAWKLRESFHGVIEKGFSRSIKKLFNNCLFAMPIITSMVLVAVIAIHSFQEAHGIPTGELSLPENRFEVFFEVSYFALIEEIGFRVTPIGAFLIIYLFWIGRKNAVTLSLRQRLKLFLKAPLFPDEAKKIVGARTVGEFGVRGGISLGEWIMVLFTSIVFGLAHYLFGGGWEIGKVTSAFVVGLAAGLTYLLYGFQAPILLHWFFNYYNYAYYLASELSTLLLIIFLPVYAVTIIFGCLGWLAVLILGLRKMFGTAAKTVKSLLIAVTSFPRFPHKDSLS